MRASMAEFSKRPARSQDGRAARQEVLSLSDYTCQLTLQRAYLGKFQGLFFR